jgi:hypothetical protein
VMARNALDWPDSNGYIYNEGDYEDYWKEGHYRHEGSVTKYDTYVLLQTLHVSGIRTFSTSSKVDITGYSYVKMQWSNAFWLGSGHLGYLSLTTTDGVGTTTGPLSTYFSASSGTATIDISAYSGEYYIHTHLQGNDGYGAQCRVEKVWLE